MAHIEGQFEGCKNLTLYYQCWLPSHEPKAVLLVAHGLAEHSGRYTNLANHFVPKGYAVYGFDQRGHGKSPGLRGDVESFSCFVNDLKTFLGIIHDKHPGTKVFILGHSVGGAIATACAISHQDKFDGLILSAATIKAGNSVPPGLIMVASLLASLLPKVGLYTIDASALSCDKAIVDAYVNDPLVYQGKIRTRLGVEIIKAMQMLLSQIERIHLPILIMHGTADRLSDPKGSELLYNGVNSKDRTLKLYDRFFHEIFNEPGCAQVFADIEGWLAAHVRPRF